MQKKKKMNVEQLKTYIEERYEINFNYDVLEESKTDSNYYLKSKPFKSGSWLEIYQYGNAEKGLFNMYLVHESDIERAWISCSADGIEDHLRKDFNINTRQSQARLF